MKENLVNLNVVLVQLFLVRELFSDLRTAQANKFDMSSFLVLQKFSLARSREVALVTGNLLYQFFNLWKEKFVSSAVFSFFKIMILIIINLLYLFISPMSKCLDLYVCLVYVCLFVVFLFTSICSI